MPLAPPALESAIAALTGDNSPASPAAAAQAWADAAQAMFAGVVPASTTVTAAAATLKTAIETAFGATSGLDAALESAFAAFAVTIAGGMLPLYTGIPPPAPVGFVAMLSTNRPSLDAFAADLADALDTWAKTGTATLVAPPNTLTPWA
jgi:hypothetical protein